MKKYLFFLLYILSNCFAYGQSVNVIQVNEKNEARHSYLVSCIDSLIHHIDRKLQLYIGGETYEYNIEDIDSVSIGKEDVKVFYLTNYIEGTETYFFSNGCAVNISEDSIKGYTIVIDSLDFRANKWDEDKALALYCDSLFRPIMAVSNNGKLQFIYQDTDNSFSIKIIDSDGNVSEITDISIQNSYTTRSYNLRRASTDGNWRDGANNALRIVNLTRSVLQRDMNGIYAELLPDLVPQGIPRDIASSIAGSIGTYFETNIFGRALGLFGLVLKYTQLISDLRDWIVKQEIGDITPKITNLKQVDNGSVDLRIEFSGDGFLTSTKDVPLFQINYWREVNGQMILNSRKSTTPQNAHYGFRTERISNLNGDNWAFQVVVYPSRFSVSDFLVANYNFRSNIMRTDMGRIYISELSQTSDYYSDNKVTISMRALLTYQSDVDKGILSAYNDYGLYVKRGNKTPDLYSVKQNGGLEFFVNFDFTKNELDLNYNTYKATPKEDIRFGVYTIDGYGLRNYYDEQSTEMSYHKVPKAETGDKVSVEETVAVVKCTYDGCMFWGMPCGIEYGYENIIERGIVTADFDGEQEIHLTELTPGKTYSYRAYYEKDGEKKYGEPKTFTTKSNGLCPDDNHPHMIDLGLPSGTKWACCNVGASKPEEAGALYAWGETNTKPEFRQDNYEFCPYPSVTYQEIGNDISGTNYDTAKENWGSKWQMANLEDTKELINNCSVSITEYNGIKGALLKGRNGSNFKEAGKIFLPCNMLSIEGKPFLMYWTSTYKEKPNNYNQSAYQLVWSNYLSFGIKSNGQRCDGKGVRPIQK